jgi:hypothetical protein
MAWSVLKKYFSERFDPAQIIDIFFDQQIMPLGV